MFREEWLVVIAVIGFGMGWQSPRHDEPCLRVASRACPLRLEHRAPRLRELSSRFAPSLLANTHINMHNSERRAVLPFHFPHPHAATYRIRRNSESAECLDRLLLSSWR